jgi:hypothetical protein
MLLMESMRVPRYFRRIINNIPLLDEPTLVCYFDILFYFFYHLKFILFLLLMIYII